MKVLINYSSLSFRASQRLNSQSGLEYGNFDHVVSYGPANIDAEFARCHRSILRQHKGAGLWLWKPYVVRKTLSLLRDGDFLFYSDSGARFISAIDPIVEVCRRYDQDVVPFELAVLERTWTKRDTFIAMNCDLERYTNTRQRLASFFMLRKSKLATRFADEYLSYATDPHVVGDWESDADLPNYPGFREHRHDQSIFSLLTKQYGFQAFRDPSQWGNGLMDEYPTSNYRQLIDHTRQRTHSVIAKLLHGFDRPRAAVNRAAVANIH